MPRLADDTSVLIADLSRRLTNLVSIARKEGRDAALADVRGLIGGSTGAPTRGPGRPKGSKNAPAAAKPTKSGKRRKNSWSGMTAEQRLARVNAIRKGRGLAPKSA